MTHEHVTYKYIQTQIHIRVNVYIYTCLTHLLLASVPLTIKTIEVFFWAKW
jgi:hypothetical protein